MRQRITRMVIQVTAAHVTIRPMRRASIATLAASASAGRTLLITAAPIRRTAIAPTTRPLPLPELLQHDGLHMTGRQAVGSVKHATHLFLDWIPRGISVACRAGGWQSPRPAFR